MLFKEDTVAREEHTAIRQNVGWYEWTHDLVEISGKSAYLILDYLCVNTIANLEVGQSKYSTMLDENGKIIDDVIVSKVGENCFWVSTLYAPKLLPRLGALITSDLDLQFKELTECYKMYAIQGPNALKMVNAILDIAVDDLKRFSMVERLIDKIPIRIHRSGFTGELGYEIYCHTSDSKAIEAALRGVGRSFRAVEPTILEVIVRSIPMEKGFALRQDLYGLTPYECGLGWSVKMDKEFVGKESLIHAEKAGNIFQLVGLEFQAESYEDISQGEAVNLYGIQIGIVRAAIYGYTVEKNIGFAIIDANIPMNTKVTVGCNNSPAIVVDKKWL
ncbi:aminomethyltransferase family protein [Eubacteriaceae bacterium ES2]|nr:aminomethyltransferase family protein [Eubacteriaceae bacterium ES2]